MVLGLQWLSSLEASPRRRVPKPGGYSLSHSTTHPHRHTPTTTTQDMLKRALGLASRTVAADASASTAWAAAAAAAAARPASTAAGVGALGQCRAMMMMSTRGGRGMYRRSLPGHPPLGFFLRRVGLTCDHLHPHASHPGTGKKGEPEKSLSATLQEFEASLDANVSTHPLFQAHGPDPCVSLAYAPPPPPPPTVSTNTGTAPHDCRERRGTPARGGGRHPLCPRHPGKPAQEAAAGAAAYRAGKSALCVALSLHAYPLIPYPPRNSNDSGQTT